uniref:ENTH domain-containing protein n=1 Tax=Moniliophthora roreri TaxID=221103 RepID=A0A0W0FPK3_MONRR
MQHFGKAALRATKNYTKGYSDTQAKVRDATSNDPWGPTGQQMNEIAKLSWNQQDFIEIIEILDKRLNDKGKNWRHVFKTLAVIDYCLLQGSEDVVRYYKENLYVIKTLREFQYVDEDGTDQGANVRQRAKDITNLLMDDSKIRTQRRNRADARDRMRQGDRSESFPPDTSSRRGRKNKEDEDLQRAIEESMKSGQGQMTQEEKDLQRAIELSQEDEAKRSKSIDDANASATESALFDDSNQLPPPNVQLQFNNNPFPMDGSLQPQFTQMQPQFAQMQMQPQFTSFNPYQQQMQEAAQAEYLRQQEAFQQQQAQQQQEEWMRQQMMMQQQQFQQQQQQQQSLSPQQSSSLFPQQTALAPQPTGFGANNPFAQFPSSPSPSSPSNQNNQRNNQLSFNIQGTYDSGKHLQTHDLSTSSSAFRSPSPGSSSAMQSPSSPSQQGNRPIHVKPKQNENQELANLFADRDGGQDTFGNVGVLRYGHTDAGRLIAAQQTPGKNPFAMQQQNQQNTEQPFFSL